MVLKKGIIGGHSVIDCSTILNPQKYELQIKLNIYINSKCYYRCEVELELGYSFKRFALTNPIWVEPYS